MRLAAGRARALGLPTRGTTAPQRLRRVDRWLVGTQAPLLRATDLVVDLGYGATTVTTVEMAERLRTVNPALRVVGVENDRTRVAAAAGVEVAYGGFDLAGLRPGIVRAMNVLRQYDESSVAAAWERMTATGAYVLDGTCDEVGRRGSWVWLGPDGPLSLTLSAHLASLGRPSDLAERLPKALIHRNVRGEPVHDLFTALDTAWDRAPRTFGPRQRWMQTCGSLDLPVLDGPRRWRLGELTIPWSAVAPGRRERVDGNETPGGRR